MHGEYELKDVELAAGGALTGGLSDMPIRHASSRAEASLQWARRSGRRAGGPRQANGPAARWAGRLAGWLGGTAWQPAICSAGLARRPRPEPEQHEGPLPLQGGDQRRAAAPLLRGAEPLGPSCPPRVCLAAKPLHPPRP